jgi:peroxiredoxin Q/BCP
MKKLIFLIILAGFVTSSSGQTVLFAGSKAPLFKARSDEGNIWKLADYIGQKNIVLYFYPAAMTGGCTAQACGYRDHMADFGNLDAIVVGISGDDVNGLKAFKKAEQLNFTLISDNDGDIARMYGVPVSEGGSITRKIDEQDVVLKRGVTAKRYTFVIGKDGLIRYMNAQVDAQNDYKAVLDILSRN